MKTQFTLPAMMSISLNMTYAEYVVEYEAKLQKFLRSGVGAEDCANFEAIYQSYADRYDAENC